MIERGTVVRHGLTVRNLTVTRTRRLSPNFVRITVSGDDLADFTSSGPADHAKLFFPNPVTGELAAPLLTSDGLQHPEAGTAISRDYTPRAFRAAADDAPAELDFDFVTHASGGPAVAWAAKAEPGDSIVAVGPRGSHLPPTGVSRFVLIADETALPAMARWIELLPEDTKIIALAELSTEADAGYLDPAHVNRAKVCWFRKGDGALERAVRALGPIADDTYVWAAGEATSLVPIRRYLLHELGLHRDQVNVNGYWKHGVEALDHHAPLDPSDPD